MNILKRADELVNGDRGADYGHPSDNFGCSAAILRALVKRRYGVDVPFTPDFIGLLMAVAIKGSREAGKHGVDNLTDMVGYAQTIEMCCDSTETAGERREAIKRRA